MILLDANILIHSRQPASPHYPAITQRLTDFAVANEDLAVCPQVLYEYYTVVTRPAAQNGYGITSDDAMQQINDFKSSYTFIDDPENLLAEWQSIIDKYKTIGKPAHDARLVALMQAQAIDTIYTMNPADFNRYADIITVLN
jgi:predicted nucleic acid-binding protein